MKSVDTAVRQLHLGARWCGCHVAAKRDVWPRQWWAMSVTFISIGNIISQRTTTNRSAIQGRLSCWKIIGFDGVKKKDSFPVSRSIRFPVNFNAANTLFRATSSTRSRSSSSDCCVRFLSSLRHIKTQVLQSPWADLFVWLLVLPFWLSRHRLSFLSIVLLHGMPMNNLRRRRSRVVRKISCVFMFAGNVMDM